MKNKLMYKQQKHTLGAPCLETVTVTIPSNQYKPLVNVKDYRLQNSEDWSITHKLSHWTT
jgi:hypothetical protein